MDMTSEHHRTDLSDIEYEMEGMFRRWLHRRQRANHLGFEFRWFGATFKGDNMTGTIPSGLTTLPGTVFPELADLSPSKATLSNVTLASSDTTVFTVAADPNTPNGFICTRATGAADGGSATLNASATATEADGTTHTITGTATIALGLPTPPPAASLGFTFGTPS